MFDVSDSAAAAVHYVGKEQTPVVIIDGFLRCCESLLDEAYQKDFIDRAVSHYPGVRARLPVEYVASVLVNICPLIRRIYAIPAGTNASPSLAHFSLVSTMPEDLSLFQTVPHFDSERETQFAVLHYLGPGRFSGTGFFRHRKTDFERISYSRMGTYMTEFRDQFERFGLPEKRYITGSDRFYELISSVEYQENRLVIYPGNLLHSGLIQPHIDIQRNPRVGRLTANIFVDFA